MWNRSFGFVVCLLSIKPVMSGIFCKDSVIDSIAYADDMQMYFIASSGYYWWIKSDLFPPKDSDAQKLPSPFKTTTAAVYINSQNGCEQPTNTSRRLGKRGLVPGQKMIWITEYIGGKHKFMSFDTKMHAWSMTAINYDDDHCLAKARMEWASGKPVDAMFSRNFLDIYIIMGNSYAMVNCKFICKEPTNEFGRDFPPNPTTDLQTKDQILAAFMNQNNINIFVKQNFYLLSIVSSVNGSLTTQKATGEKNVLIDFLKFSKPEECTGDVMTLNVSNDINVTDGYISESPAESTYLPEVESIGEKSTGAAPALEVSAKSDDKTVGGPLLYIIIGITAVIVIICVIICIFFVIRRKKGDKKGGEAAEKSNKKGRETKGPEKSQKSGQKSEKSEKEPTKPLVKTDPKSKKKGSSIGKSDSVDSTGSGYYKALLKGQKKVKSVSQY